MVQAPLETQHVLPIDLLHGSFHCLLLLKVPFEGVQAVRPKPAVRRKPGIYLHEWFGAQAVEAPLRVLANPDEADLPEHPKVLGNAGLAEREVPDQLPHRQLTLAEQVEDTPPVWVG